jgi:hypothetical protein
MLQSLDGRIDMTITNFGAIRKAFLGAMLLTSIGYTATASASAPLGLSGMVTKVDVSYMPATILFTLSSGDSHCAAGKTLSYSSANSDTVKAVYSLLLAAMLSGRTLGAFYWIESVDTGPFTTNACAMTVINLN